MFGIYAATRSPLLTPRRQSPARALATRSLSSSVETSVASGLRHTDHRGPGRWGRAQGLLGVVEPRAGEPACPGITVDERTPVGSTEAVMSNSVQTSDQKPSRSDTDHCQARSYCVRSIPLARPARARNRAILEDAANADGGDQSSSGTVATSTPSRKDGSLIRALSSPSSVPGGFRSGCRREVPGCSYTGRPPKASRCWWCTRAGRSGRGGTTAPGRSRRARSRAEGEDLYACARREYEEEIGRPPPEGPTDLGEVRQAGGKIVRAWGLRSRDGGLMKRP